jgi:hypothetical protein
MAMMVAMMMAMMMVARRARVSAVHVANVDGSTTGVNRLATAQHIQDEARPLPRPRLTSAYIARTQGNLELAQVVR